jgi:hypothetical protein
MSQESLREQASIHLDHLEYIKADEAREAYMVLLLAGLQAGYRTVAKSYPDGKRDVHFADRRERPFGLIANQDDIRVYLRKPGDGSDPVRRSKFLELFGDRVGQPDGEMAANVRNASEAALAASILFNAP